MAVACEALKYIYNLNYISLKTRLAGQITDVCSYFFNIYESFVYRCLWNAYKLLSASDMFSPMEIITRV